MKSAIAILALCGYASAAVIHYGAPAVGVLTSGTSSQFRSQDNIGNYAFGYNEDHSTGGTFRREQGSAGVKVGSYGLKDIDGRTRVVNYVADAAGFRANIQTNEPGVEPKDPAHVLINKAQAIVDAAPLVAAPVAPVAYASQVAYGSPVAAVHAPLAYASPVAAHSYSVNTQHVGPSVVSYAASPLAYSAPLAAYATKTIASPVVQSYVNAW